MRRSFPHFEELIGATPVISRGGQGNPVITGLGYDSRDASPGDLFFALSGKQGHGGRFVGDALERGAVALLSDAEISVQGVPFARVADARIAMADVSRSFYHAPSDLLGVAGVTGTNGKTTTAWIIRHLSKDHARVGRSPADAGTHAGRGIPGGRP
jgi:UDP-N-acetylmuramoyl-L-alanyl-D-glutamate--2,6-diaminopimelate ligase